MDIDDAADELCDLIEEMWDEWGWTQREREWKTFVISASADARKRKN
jgi:hypothetical protein